MKTAPTTPDSKEDLEGTWQETSVIFEQLVIPKGAKFVVLKGALELM